MVEVRTGHSKDHSTTYGCSAILASRSTFAEPASKANPHSQQGRILHIQTTTPNKEDPKLDQTGKSLAFKPSHQKG